MAEPLSAPGLAAMQAVNRRYWDELVGVHLAPEGYDLTRLRGGAGWLGALVETELAKAAETLSGKRIIHLQCHFGADTLALAQRGATVVGVDFSPAAIAAARALAAELGLEGRARFVECDLYDAPDAVGATGSFDLAFVTWGALCWLPDLHRWAAVVARFLRPGGRLYLADAHPAAYVFDDAAPGDGDRPGWFAPYFKGAPIAIDDVRDYANPAARLQNSLSYSWVHPLAAIVTALRGEGLALRFLHEHDCVPWPMFRCLRKDDEGMYRWPDQPWLPLSFSLLAERPAASRAEPGADPAFTLRPIAPADRAAVDAFNVRFWGETRVVEAAGSIETSGLPGALAEAGGAVVGVITWRREGDALKIVSIAAEPEGVGIGRALLAAAEAEARRLGATRIVLSTTNDNLRALGFYQRAGFRLVRLHPGATARLRATKPSIPEVAPNGIPIRDQLDLEKPLPPHPATPPLDPSAGDG